jgi:hypothetical protein
VLRDVRGGQTAAALEGGSQMTASLRVCARCHGEMPIEAFPIKDKARGTRTSYCVPCRSEYGKEHYRRNTRYYRAKAGPARERSRGANNAIVDAFLRTHPCIDCGETDPIVLDFDHVDPKLKTGNVGHLQHSNGEERLQAEMNKCVVRCANCHRRKTAQQFGWWRTLIATQAHA